MAGGTVTAGAPAGNSYSAAALVAGTTWNTVGMKSVVGTASVAGSISNIYANLALVDSAGNSLTPTLSVSYYNKVTTGTRTQPSTGSGENTIQPGGVMQYAWRNYFNGNGNYFIFAFSGLPVSTKYGLFYFGGTGSSGQGAGVQLAPANVLGTYAASNTTANTTANSAGVYGSIWTVASGSTSLMPAGSTWQMLSGQSDASGNFAFYFNGAGNAAYLNGFQLVPLAAPLISGLSDQTVVQSNSLVLAPVATGLPAPVFQWQTNGVNVSGATNGSLAVNNIQYAQNGWVYSLIASNTAGVTTGSMTLTVTVTPTITGLPATSAAAPGQTVEFNPAVGGVPAPALQWQYNGVNLADGDTANGSTVSGSSGSDLKISRAQSTDSGSYTLIASNSAGAVSNSIYLTVSEGDVAPLISGLADQTVIQGSNAVFSAAVSGLPTPDLQWQLNGAAIPGATANVLTLPNVSYAQNGYVYSLVASNTAGAVTNSATLHVLVPVSISASPTNLVVTNTQSATFAVTAAGVPAPACQWYFNGAVIAGATGPSYTLASATPSSMGAYSVVVTNSINCVTSAVANLLVDSAMSVTALAPANGATGLCIDAPLSISFSSVVSNGSIGRIAIYNAANPATPVDVIDMTLPLAQQSKTIGGSVFNYYPTICSGSTVSIYPHITLAYNQTYYVTVTSAFTDATGACFSGISDTNAWRFATRAAGPAPATTNLVVAADGSGDFCTVQAAVDFSSITNNAHRVLVSLRNGYYKEIVNMSASKSNMTFRGQDRKQTVILYPNNVSLQVLGGGSTSLRPAFTCAANDCAMENLTLTNSTPIGGSQAEALRIGAARFVMLNCDLDSYQDTLLVNTTGNSMYVQDSLIQGQTDFVWGGGTLYCTNCELRCLLNGSHVTQPRSAAGTNGYSFVNCRVTAASGVTSSDLGRSIGTPSTPSQTIFIHCLMDDAITGYNSDAGAYFEDCLCSNLTATASRTLAYSSSLPLSNPTVVAALDPTAWFYGWVPQLAPNLLTNPVGQSVAGGGALTLTAYATGVPAPAYQWFKNGSAIAGQTGATLTIPAAHAGDDGSYTVVAQNSAGSVSSSSVLVTIGNTAPTLAAITDQTVNVGVTVTINPVATDPDVPSQTLSFSFGGNPPAGAALDSQTGKFTWRPNVSQAGASYPVTLVVADNGTPVLNATQTFNIVVNPLTQPNLNAPSWNGQQFGLTVKGQAGPDYIVLASTNLVDWAPIFTNSSPAMPFFWSDPESSLFPMRFYRIQPGPLP